MRPGPVPGGWLGGESEMRSHRPRWPGGACASWRNGAPRRSGGETAAAGGDELVLARLHVRQEPCLEDTGEVDRAAGGALVLGSGVIVGGDQGDVDVGVP